MSRCLLKYGAATYFYINVQSDFKSRSEPLLFIFKYEMKLTKTLKFKLDGLTEHDKYVLNQTRRQFRRCVNFYLHEIGYKASTTKTDYKKEYCKAKSKHRIKTPLIQQARDFAINQYKSYKNNENNNHFPHFKSFVDARYDKRTISFIEENEETSEIEVTLATTQNRVEATLQGGEYQFNEFQAGSFCDARLRREGGEWYLKIHIEREAEIQDAKKSEYYIGVDLGVNNLATIAVQNRDGEVVETKFFDGSYVSEKRRRFNAKRREYMRKGLWSKLKETKGKESRFIKSTIKFRSTSKIYVKNMKTQQLLWKNWMASEKI